MQRGSLLGGFALVVFGGFAGALLHSLFLAPHATESSGYQESAPAAESSAELTEQLHRLESTIEGLNQAVISLSLSNPDTADAVPDRVPLDAPDTGDDPSPTPAERATLKSIPDLEKLGWTKLVSSHLGKVLVEYGLTPFDPGVNLILPEAASQIRAAQRVCDDSFREVKARYAQMKAQGHPQGQEENREIRELLRVRDEELKKIADAFRTRIRDLALGNP